MWKGVDTNPEKIRGYFTGYEVHWSCCTKLLGNECLNLQERSNEQMFFTCLSKVRFWKSDDPSTVRTERLILQEWTPCHNVDAKNRVTRMSRQSPDELHEVVTNVLWPYSSITAGVVVLNGAKSSDLSDVVHFETPEGCNSTPNIYLLADY